MCLPRVRSRRLNHLRRVSYALGLDAHQGPTSYKQHLALLLHCPDAWFLVVLFLLSHEYCLFDVAKNEVAMRVVCLFLLVSSRPCARTALGKLTCSLPFNSRSPRNLTMTISSMHRRTRSSGSLVSSLSSIVGCVLRIELQSDDHHEVQLWQLRSCLARGPSSRVTPT
jgi:hypothetical protein